MHHRLAGVRKEITDLRACHKELAISGQKSHYGLDDPGRSGKVEVTWHSHAWFRFRAVRRHTVRYRVQAARFLRPGCCSSLRGVRFDRSWRSCQSPRTRPRGPVRTTSVRAVRALKQGSTVAVAGALGLGRELFAGGMRADRATTVPLIVSTSLHVIAVASILFIASLGFAVADERTEPVKEPEPMRMVFLALPGPGGGGGGGGLKMKALRRRRCARASKRSTVRSRRSSFRHRSRFRNRQIRRSRSTPSR